jgi:hypothetical protein
LAGGRQSTVSATSPAVDCRSVKEDVAPALSRIVREESSDASISLASSGLSSVSAAQATSDSGRKAHVIRAEIRREVDTPPTVAPM